MDPIAWTEKVWRVSMSDFRAPNDFTGPGTCNTASGTPNRLRLNLPLCNIHGTLVASPSRFTYDPALDPDPILDDLGRIVPAFSVVLPFS